jgi:hypothetical protein
MLTRFHERQLTQFEFAAQHGGDSESQWPLLRLLQAKE